MSSALSRRRSSQSRLATALVVASAFSVAAASAPLDAQAKRGRTSATGAVHLRLGPARIDAPIGALPSHRRVSIKRIGAALGGQAQAFAFRVVGAAQPRHAVRLTLPLRHPAPADSLIAVAYQGSDGGWYATSARVLQDRLRAVARVWHLSNWTAVDVSAVVDAAFARAAAAAAPAAARAAPCPNSDATVSVTGEGALQVCASDPSGDRTRETVTITNPTGTAYKLSAFTGGLHDTSLTLGQYGQDVLPQGQRFVLDYDASVAHSQLVYVPSTSETVKTAVVSLLGGLFGKTAGFVIQVGTCIEKHSPSSFVAGVAQAVQCIITSGASDLKIGGLALGGLGRTLEERVLSGAISKALGTTAQHGAPGGTITLTAVQQLPPAGGQSGANSQPGQTPVPGPQPVPQQPPPSPPTQPGPPLSYFIHHVQGTCYDGACGLRERTGPGYSNYAIVGTIYDGDEVDIVCQAVGQIVGPGRNGLSSDIWDKLTNGDWVADYYVDTPGVGTFSSPIPQC